MNEETRSRIIEMAWDDRTPFDAIHASYGLSESEVIKLMRTSLKRSSFRLWRKRVTGRKAKHTKIFSTEALKRAGSAEESAAEYSPRLSIDVDKSG